jgi:hypothetical protein
MAFQKMRLIQAQRPEDRALVHGMAAALLQKEGRGKQAEWEYLECLNAWNESGRGDTADAAAVLAFLSLLYIDEQRLDDARRVLDRALAILGTARDTVPLDWIKFLNIRAVCDENAEFVEPFEPNASRYIWLRIGIPERAGGG